MDLETLHDPYRLRMSDLLGSLSTTSSLLRIREMFCCAGVVENFDQHSITLDLLDFTPGHGFCTSSASSKSVVVHVHDVGHRSIHLHPGMEVVVCGLPLYPPKDSDWHFQDNAIVCPRPHLDSSSAFNYVHMFSGSYSGWSQAATWIAKANIGQTTGQQLSIDSDDTVIQLWSLKHNTRPFRSPVLPQFVWTPSDHVAVQSCVGDCSFLHLCAHEMNVLATLSPPCVSWSRGGKGRGLNHEAGWAFVEAIEDCLIMQPNIITAECVDEIWSHSHFNFVLEVIQRMGYIKIFSQVVPHHTISDHARSRWLATWVRRDHTPRICDLQIKPMIIPREKWTSPVYSFPLPACWERQLRLSDSEVDIYNEVDFLPPNKRARFGSHRNVKDLQVVESRFPQAGEPLPTLCASYSSQHLLAPNHLHVKGIFAVLENHSRGVSFFDPARFCSLFGACETVILPSKIQEAFKCVGNAITIQHGIIPIIIGLQAAFKEILDVHQLIKQSWSERLTCRNAIVFQKGDFVYLARIEDAILFLSPQPSLPEHSDNQVLVTCPCFRFDRVLMVPKTMCFEAFVRCCFQGPLELTEAISLSDGQQTVDPRTRFDALRSIRVEWVLTLKSKSFGSLTFVCREYRSANQLPKPEVTISPTLPFSAQVIDDSTSECMRFSEPFDQLVTSAEFDAFITAFEHVVNHDGNALEEVLILCPKLQEFFAAVIPRQMTNTFIQMLRLSASKKGGSVSVVENTATTRHNQQLRALLDNSARPDKVYSSCGSGPPGVDNTATTSNPRFHALTAMDHRAGPSQVVVLDCSHPLSKIGSSAIRAGGHHGFRGIPMTLQANASFEQRVAFAIESHGWLASDELHYICQLIQWTDPDGPHFSPIVYWDVRQNDFEESPFGDLSIAATGKTIVPILFQAHWGAVNVERNGDHIHLRIHQVPQPLQQSLLRIMARRLDIGIYRITWTAEQSFSSPHMCGWDLVHSWIHAAQIRDQLPDISIQVPVAPPNVQDAISNVIEASMESWRFADATPAVALLAAKLRKDFFFASFNAVANGNPASEHELLTAFPFHHVSPPDPPIALRLREASIASSIEPKIRDRPDHLLMHKGWMATDEMNSVLDFARKLNPETLFAVPSIWCPGRNMLIFPAQPPPEIRPYDHIIWPLIFDHHWIQVEVFRATQFNRTSMMVTAPHSTQQKLNGLISYIMNVLGAFPAHVSITYITQTVPPNLCGYAVLKDILDRMMISVPNVSPRLVQTLSHSRFAGTIARSQRETRAMWDQSSNDREIKAFADRVRTAFLVQIIQNDFPPEYFAGGMENKQNSPPGPATPADPSGGATPADMKVDSVWVNDPWKPKIKARPQTRWEDLLLIDDHPFKGTNGKPIDQIHRLQASPWRGGIIMSTKSHLPDLLHLDPQDQDVAVLLPASDPSAFGGLANRLEGPHEVVLRDEAAKSTYKRLVLLLVVKGKVVYQLPKPTIKFNTIEVAEIVLEIDERFLSKSDYERYKDQPIQAFRKLTAAAVGDKASEFIFYGFRTNHHPSAPRDCFQLQCIVKIPLGVRKTILELSGRHTLFTRDYLERGQGSLDTSVLPKFWQTTQAELQNMLISTKDTHGAAGVIITRRGLALRVWAAQIGAARSTLLAGDPRITKENQNVVPKFSYEASGWPVGSTAANVVHATLTETKAAPIPTRTFRVAGVVTWVLAFDKKPDKDRFTIEVNGTPHEILLQETSGQITSKQVGVKGSGKKGGKAARALDPKGPTQPGPFVPVPSTNAQDNARIQKLEERFDRIEARQTRFEERVDHKFDHISDSLRQLLQTVGPSRSREVTGETPPAKSAKQG